MNPTQLTIKIADKNGRMEGWLRLRFELNNSFRNLDIGVGSSRWAATDIYIDGNYIASYGNTGLNGKPYKENRELLSAIQPLHIETGKEHVLAVHIVDYVAPLDHRHLKTSSMFNNFGSLVMLTGPSANKNMAASITKDTNLLSLYCGVIIVPL